MQWSDDEVVKRVAKLFPMAARRYKAMITDDAKAEFVAIWRERLSDLSWFMRCLSEYIARRANAEDECTGRFWEGRFRSQALLDEKALLAAMSYVDLNPIRAGLAMSLEDSDWTSIRKRLFEVAEQQQRFEPEEHVDATVSKRTTEDDEPFTPVPLVPMAAASAAESSGNPGSAPTYCVGKTFKPIPVTLHEYVTLVTWAGCQASEGKRGKIEAPNTALLTRLGLTPELWLEGVAGFPNTGVLVGAPEDVEAKAPCFGRRQRANRAGALSCLYNQAVA